MEDFKKWWASVPHEFFANASHYEYAKNAFKEARKGYVKVEDVLEIIENPDCLFCKQIQIEKNGSINRYYCNENECEAFKIREIKALGDKNDKE